MCNEPLGGDTLEWPRVKGKMSEGWWLVWCLALSSCWIPSFFFFFFFFLRNINLFHLFMHSLVDSFFFVLTQGHAY